MVHVIPCRLGRPFAVVLGSALIAGCANQSRTSDTTTASAPETPSAQRRSAARSTRPLDLPIPPGIDASRLAPHEPGDTTAELPLAAAIARLSPTEVLPAPRAVQPPSDDVLRETTHLYLQARELAVDGRYFDSIRSLEQALKLDPNAIACMRLMADDYLATIGPARALRLYEDILSIDPNDLESLVRLGSAAWQRRDVGRAAGLLGRAYALLESNRENQDEEAAWFLAAHELGQVLLSQGCDQAGVAVWRELMTRLPEAPPESPRFQREIDRLYRVAPEMWRDLGDAYCRLEQFDDAVAVYAQAFGAARVSDADMLPRLIWALAQSGRADDAMEALLEAVDSPQQTGAIELVALFRDTPQREALASALRQRLEANPGELRYVQAIAGLLPPERSDAIILEFLNAHGGDSTVLRDLLPWAVQRLEPVQPVRLITTFAQRAGAPPDDLLDELVALTNDAPRFIAAWDELSNPVRETEMAQLVRVGLLRRDFQYRQAIEALDAILAAHPQSLAPSLSKANLLLVFNESDAAADLLSALPAGAAGPLELVYRRARLLAQTAQTDQALALLDEIAQQRASEIDAAEHLRRKAKVLSGAGQPAQAAEALDQALARDPQNQAVYGDLLRLYNLGGPLQDGTRFTDLVRSLYSTAPESRAFVMLRAEQDAARGRFDDAIAGYESLIAQDVTDQEAIDGLVRIWVAAGRAGEGAAWFSDKRAARPGDRRMRNAWMALLVADHRAGEVIDALRSAVAARPSDFDSYLRLEEALKSVGREEEARQVAIDRWNQQPASVARSLALAQIDLDQDQDESALNHLRTALDQASDHLDRHLEKITALASRIDADETRTAALELIESIGQEVLAQGVKAATPILLSYISAVVELNRPIDDVSAAVERCRRLLPDHDLEFTAIATVALAQQERLDDACRLCDEWLATDRPLTEDAAGLLQWRLARCADRDEPQRAIELVRRAHQSDLYKSMSILNARPLAGEKTYNPVAESLYRISGAFSSAGKEESAALILQEVLKIDPDHAGANNDLGYALADRNERLAEAEAMLVKAIKAEPDNSAFLDSLGWVRYKLGKLDNPPDAAPEAFEDAAIPLLQEAARLRRSERRSEIDTTVILDHLGDALWRAGRPQQAVDTWQQSVDNYDRFLQATRQTLDAETAQSEIDFYKRYYGDTIDVIRTKIKAVQDGKEPPVAASPALDNNQP